jgi:voltage-gated potassium channel
VGSPSWRTRTTGRRLLLFWSLPALMIGAGTVGYRMIERWSWFDSFYVAVITITSLGYGDKHAFSMGGHVLTLVLALTGITAVALAATELWSAVISGELRKSREKRRMRKKIEALERQVIVCGYGEVGRHVCAELLAEGMRVVVIDRQEDPLAAAQDAGAHTVLGDAAEDATLTRAGIERARALVAVAGADSDNVLITMTARLLCPKLPIMSRADEESTVPKLLRAGASQTASPHAIAGGRIAQAVLRPSVLDADFQIEEELVRPGSPLDGKTVGSSGLRSRHGLILVAIKRRDGRLTFHPEDDALVAAGDVLITLGSRALVRRAPKGRAHALAFSS